MLPSPVVCRFEPSDSMTVAAVPSAEPNPEVRVTAVDHRSSALRVTRGRSIGGTVRAFVALTKPRIIELLLVTTVPTMILAAHGLPPASTVLATLLGGTLAAASANVLNCVFDRDIDRLMHRTERRPLATGAVSVASAVVFGILLGIAAFLWLSFAVNLLSAVLATAAIAFYVLVYTLLLKRRTPQNIVWGGAAGCMPVLVGWAAVTDSLAWTPWVLFAIVFLWTPPHYWPLSLKFRQDYAAAGVPMLPVVRSAAQVTDQVVVYAWAMVAASLLLWPVAGTSWFYAAVAGVSGAAFLVEAYGLRSRVRRGDAEPKPMRLFHGSITYLAVLFLAVALDPLLHL
jgi:protoheme IX farnesyltransferase